MNNGGYSKEFGRTDADKPRYGENKNMQLCFFAVTPFSIFCIQISQTKNLTAGSIHESI